MKTLTLRGTLTAVGPVAVSPPGTALFKDGDKSPARLPRAGHSSNAPRYLPASTLRHLLRHHLTGTVMEALSANGRQLELGSLLVLAKGYTRVRLQSDGDGSETATKACRRLEREGYVREKNPMVGMFGAWGLPAELRVGNAHPHSKDGREVVCVRHGVVRTQLEDDLEEQMPPELLAQYEEVLVDSSRPLEERKRNRGFDGILHFREAGWEEIVAGTDCDWQIVLHRADALKAGAVLAALRRFAADPFIGAHRAMGCGEVALSLFAEMVEYEPLQNPRRERVGSVSVNVESDGGTDHDDSRARSTRVPFEVTGALRAMLAEFDNAARAGFPGWDFSVLPPNEWGGEQ